MVRLKIHGGPRWGYKVKETEKTKTKTNKQQTKRRLGKKVKEMQQGDPRRVVDKNHV